MSFLYTRDSKEEAVADAEWRRYADEHPRSPSALRRPRILFRGRNAVAMLPGAFGDDAIGGVGPTVFAALEAFDALCREADVAEKSGPTKCDASDERSSS